MNLSGQLADWTMDDLMQIVQVTKKSGTLDIRGATKGRVHFRDGQITGAELHGPQGVYAGTDPDTVADIIFVLGGLETGTFAMGQSEGPDTEGHDSEVIAGAVLELRTLESELVEAGVFEADEVRFAGEIESKLSLEPADWRLLSALIPNLALSDLEDRFGRGSAIRMLHSFQNMGVLAAPDPGDDTEQAEATTEDDELAKGEADWLDQLAESVSKGESPHWAADPDVDVEIAISASGPNESTRSHNLKGVSADASTTLTGGVYDDIRRMRSKSG